MPFRKEEVTPSDSVQPFPRSTVPGSKSTAPTAQLQKQRLPGPMRGWQSCRASTQTSCSADPSSRWGPGLRRPGSLWDTRALSSVMPALGLLPRLKPGVNTLASNPQRRSLGCWSGAAARVGVTIRRSLCWERVEFSGPTAAGFSAPNAHWKGLIWQL